MKSDASTDVKVDLANNKVTVTRTRILPIFSEKGVYRVEGNDTGFSELSKEGNDIYLNVYYSESEGHKLIQKSKLKERDVICLIIQAEKSYYGGD